MTWAFLVAAALLLVAVVVEDICWRFVLGCGLGVGFNRGFENVCDCGCTDVL